MGNTIINSFTNESVKLSTITTDLVYKSLIIEGSRIADTKWKKNVVIWLSERNQNILGTGVVGFDIRELGWTESDFQNQRNFLLKVIINSIENKTWNNFNYRSDNETINEKLNELKIIINNVQIEQIENKDLVFLIHENINTQNIYCEKHLTLKVENPRIDDHSCFICSTSSFIEEDSFTFNQITISEQYWNGDFYIITTKNDISDYKSTIEIVDKLCEQLEMRPLGNLWKKIGILEGHEYMKKGLTFDLAYSDSVIIDLDFAELNYKMLLSKLNQKEVVISLLSAYGNPWSGSYVCWSLIDESTFNIGVVLASKNSILVNVFKAED